MATGRGARLCGISDLLKRCLDICGACVAIVLFSPVLVLVPIAILLTSPGGVFFVQKRLGLHGAEFRMLKFRSMVANAEKIGTGLFSYEDDPRITRVGRFLRASSLDELPQILNVLGGSMSLVGPRPLPIEESLACKPWQRQRLQVTPGLTCIWQIHGRNVVPFDEWVRMDLEYAERRSPWLDLKLVAQTGPVLLLQKGR